MSALQEHCSRSFSIKTDAVGTSAILANVTALSATLK
jgi:hypothetical protein